MMAATTSASAQTAGAPTADNARKFIMQNWASALGGRSLELQSISATSFSGCTLTLSTKYRAESPVSTNGVEHEYEKTFKVDFSNAQFGYNTVYPPGVFISKWSVYDSRMMQYGSDENLIISTNNTELDQRILKAISVVQNACVDHSLGF
jgi:hypothetical protein